MFQFSGEDDLGWKLLRQELFCAWQFAVLEYRHGRLGESRRIMDAALQIADSMDPGSGGLLTQLYYAQAKLRLRERAFLEASVMFRKSLVAASVRFSNAGGGRDLERQAAQYSVAKALCLGLAQSLLDQGRLHEAHTVVVAGRMLLDLTPDLVHRSYAQQLLGAIERASARDRDAFLLAAARKNLEQCVGFFSQHKPAAAFRARYELGLIDLHLGDSVSSEKRLSGLLMDAEAAQSVKWTAMAHVGLARVARHMKEFDRSVKEALRARKIATKHKLRTVEINAHTAQLLTLFEQYADQPEQLEEVEDGIHELLRKIPEEDVRNRVMGLLVHVRVLAARKELRRARATYEKYERIAHLVQSPRVHDIAELALRAISTNTFVCPADHVPPEFDLEKNKEALRDYVVHKVETVHQSPDERAEALNVGVSTYYRLKGK
ncbi:MAG TPA: hypothetical protein VEK79_26070 [Thermoanaerobaculia bacterium]|nr:hypothetical protein [Thermoanaerobaculia bacterium]